MDLQQQKKLSLIYLLIFDFVQGFIGYFLTDQSGASLIFSLICLLVGIVLIMRWFILDAQQFNYQFSRAMFTMLVAFAIVAAPIYFIQTRGKGAAVQILKSLGFLLVSLSFAMLGGITAYLMALLKLRLMSS